MSTVLLSGVEYLPARVTCGQVRPLVLCVLIEDVKLQQSGASGEHFRAVGTGPLLLCVVKV